MKNKTELKTLKDLEVWDCQACGGNIMSKDEIKAEAIKWVKDEILKAEACSLDSDYNNEAIHDYCASFIMERFNITSEDLK